MNDIYKLERFVKAQENVYPIALSELCNGKKYSHWIWFVFPQIRGLGHSNKSHFYGITCIEEAKEYFVHSILGARLKEVSLVLLELRYDNIIDIMGYVDAIKLRSSMTLFYIATGDSLFKCVLDKYYQGKLDESTIEIIKQQENNV